jgi:hypothetical protein
MLASQPKRFKPEPHQPRYMEDCIEVKHGNRQVGDLMTLRGTPPRAIFRPLCRRQSQTGPCEVDWQGKGRQWLVISMPLTQANCMLPKYNVANTNRAISRPYLMIIAEYAWVLKSGNVSHFFNRFEFHKSTRNDLKEICKIHQIWVLTHANLMQLRMRNTDFESNMMLTL